MNIAVLSLTRDRLDYTRHCFTTLRENAGCDFEWFVADQASEDDTLEWLLDQSDLNVMALGENIGVCRALNVLLDEAFDPADYDVIVRFDNDCEVLNPDTLRVICELAVSNDLILAPKVLGLRMPPHPISLFTAGTPGRDFTIEETVTLGGIFMAIPAVFFGRDGFRYDNHSPLWTGDERICDWHRARGGRCGYVKAFAVNHYKTTDGQHADIPDYFARSFAEGKPAV